MKFASQLGLSASNVFRFFLTFIFFVVSGSTALRAQVPQLLNYQGRVAVGAVNFNGSGQFKFALVDSTGANTYWSNDGTSTAGSQPTAYVTFTVSNGLYSVLLGDTTLTNMTAVPNSVFTNSDVRLRVWFNDGTNGFQLLTPDQRIAAVGYAMIAGNVADGAVTSAKIASGAVGSTQLGSGLTLGGTTTGTFSGSLVGNAATATTATSFTGTLAGDVTGTEAATVVSTVSGVAASNVAAGVNLANAATSANTPSTIVKRDASGNFSGGTITASGGLNLPATTNVSIGVLSLGAVPFLHSYGTADTFVGNNAGNFTMTSGDNTAVGFSALGSNANGPDNTAVGFKALAANSAGSNNTAEGFQSLQSNTDGGNNVAIGSGALQSNTFGSYNTAVGNGALQFNTEGNSTTAVGNDALFFNTTGFGNTATGSAALFANTTGGNNTAVGYAALSANTTGSNNTAIGNNAQIAAGPASNNTAIGYNALANSTGGSNTASGVGALQLNGSGGNNTAFGANALQNNSTGSSCIGIGNNAGINLTSGSNNIDIFDQGVAGESNTIRIGTQGTQTKAFFAGIRGITTGVNNAQTVVIDSTGQLGTISSSRRYKEDIADMGEASARLLALRPVTFRYKKPYANGDKPIQFGLIAEEVAETFPELTVFDEKGEPESVKYQDLPPLLLNEFLKDHHRADARDTEVKTLQTENTALKERLAELEAKDKEREAREQEREARLSRLESLFPATSSPTVLKTASSDVH